MMALLKFGQQEHIEQLRSEGLLYCNTLRYFREVEGDENRSDRNEGLAAFYPPDMVKITLGISEGRTVEVDAGSGLTGPVRIAYDATLERNVYCMYALTPQSLYVDPRNFQFGPWCLAIHDLDEFRRRISATAQTSQLGVKAKTVEYYDESVFSGAATAFHKSERFRYQSELRFVLSPGRGVPYSFVIGSLEDISVVVAAEKVNDSIRILSGRLLAGGSE